MKIVHASESAKQKYAEVRRIDAEIKRAEGRLAELRREKRAAIEVWGSDPGTLVDVGNAP